MVKKDKQSLSSAAQILWQVNYTQLLTCIFFSCVTGECVYVYVCVYTCRYAVAQWRFFILLSSCMHKWNVLRCLAAISVCVCVVCKVCMCMSLYAPVLCLCSKGLQYLQTVLFPNRSEAGSGSCTDSAAGWVIVTVVITQTPLCTLFPNPNSSLTICNQHDFWQTRCLQNSRKWDRVDHWLYFPNKLTHLWCYLFLFSVCDANYSALS